MTTSRSKSLIISNRSRVDRSLEDKCQSIDATAWGRVFSYEYIQHLAEYMDLYNLKRGDNLFSEGDQGSYFILILQGRLNILKHDEHNELKQIATLAAGNTIGEMALIDHQSRSASVIAATDVSILVMTTESFNQLCKARPRVSLALVMRFAKQMSQHLRLTSGKLIDYLE